MSAGKAYCRQDFRRHTLSVVKTLYRRTVRRYSGVLPSDSLWAIMCHGVVYFTLALHVSLCGLASWRVAGANRRLDSAQPLAHVNVAWRRFWKDHNFDVVSISRIYFAKCWIFCLFKIHGLREYEFEISTHSCDSCPRQIKWISTTKVFGAK